MRCRWDEERYGLEYDLGLFNVVSVSDFSMGAMENKSLNIFNSRLVLASPETATDSDFSRIQVRPACPVCPLCDNLIYCRLLFWPY